MSSEFSFVGLDRVSRTNGHWKLVSCTCIDDRDSTIIIPRIYPTRTRHEGRCMSQTDYCIQLQPPMSNSKDRRSIEVPFDEAIWRSADTIQTQCAQGTESQCHVSVAWQGHTSDYHIEAGLTRWELTEFIEGGFLLCLPVDCCISRLVK